jgi:hypothetical protein
MRAWAGGLPCPACDDVEERMTPAHAWALAELADALGAGLERAAAAVELEQAVRGLDARDELALHPLLHGALRDAGHGVAAEVRYPGDRTRTRRSEGRRCDVVVTPRGLPLVEDRPQLDLFRPAAACALADALWLEVKAVAQFVEGGPNRAYARAIQAPVWRDVEKLASDEGIRHAALAFLLFTADEEVARHDLGIWASRGAGRGLPIGAPHLRAVAIGDRLGNRLCTVALYPIAR